MAAEQGSSGRDAGAPGAPAGASRRLFRLVAEVLRAIEAGVFHPVTGWHCKDCPFRSRCWAWGGEAGTEAGQCVA